MSFSRIIRNGLIDENPTFAQVIGMCPTLAVTTSAINGIGMGLATTFVLVGSNVVISMIKKIVPDNVRIPAYVIVIASFVTIIEFLLKAFLPDLNNALGVFIPLIVVNCIILARAESYANKNTVIDSMFDGIGMGIGFTFALTIMGVIREFLGNGSVFDITLLPEAFPRTTIMILPPGAFFTLGFLIAFMTYLKRKNAEKKRGAMNGV